jgi:hypothetical protein
MVFFRFCTLPFLPANSTSRSCTQFNYGMPHTLLLPCLLDIITTQLFFRHCRAVVLTRAFFQPPPPPPGRP